MRVRSYDLLLLSLALLVLLIIGALLPLTPQDYWWYLRLGQDIATTGAVPRVDSYSFTQAGAPYHFHSWLAALALWAAHSAGGTAATFLLRLIVIALAYGILWFILRKAGAGPRTAAVLALAAGLAGSSNWSIRPQLLALPLFAAALLVLWNWEMRNARLLWLLPVISLLWVNLHGSFPLLFVLLIPALIFGSGDRRQLVWASALAVVALLINPRGIAAVQYVGAMLSSPSNRFSNEWLPAVNRGWQANLFFAWFLLIAPTAALSKQRLSRLEWAWLLLFGWLGLYAARYGIWCLFILPLVTARFASAWTERAFERPVERERPAVNLAAACLLLLLPIGLLPGVRERWWISAPAAFHDVTPVAAVNWLAAHPELEGPLWSDFSQSSYLIFALPSRPVWIDPRFELYPPAQWQRYQAIAGAAPEWQSLLDEEGINLVLLSTGGEPRLIRAMERSDTWDKYFQDASGVIFGRHTE